MTKKLNIKSIIYLLILNLIYNLSYACSNIELSYIGDATAFGGNSNSGFCGFKENSFLYSNKLQVALNEPQWNNSLNCGRCVSIQYENRPPLIALISDKCQECKYGDLDLFEESYRSLISNNYGREKIKWEFTKCNNFVNGNIKLRIDYINRYWLSINPENFLCGFSNIEISFGSEWIELDRNDNVMNGLYFNYNGYVQTPFKLRLTSKYNEKLITQSYNDILNILQTDLQFTC